MLLKLPNAKLVFATLVIACFLQSACIIAYSWALASFLGLLFAAKTFSDTLVYLTIFASFFIGEHLVRLIKDWALGKYAYARSQNLRQQLMQKVFDKPQITIRECGSAHLVQMSTSGTEKAQTYIQLMLDKIANIIGIALPLLITVFVCHMVSGIILLVLFACIAFYMNLLGKSAKDQAKREYSSYKSLTNYFADTLRGLTSIQLCAAQEREKNKVFENSENLRKKTVQTLKTATLSGAALDLLSTLGAAAIAMMLGIELLSGGGGLDTAIMELSTTMGLGSFGGFNTQGALTEQAAVAFQSALFVLILSVQYFKPLRNFAANFHACLEGKEALADIMNSCFISNAHDRDDNKVEDAPHNKKERAPHNKDNDEHHANKEHFCLHDITLDLNSHETFVIVGSSGAGKSTLLSCLAGFLPNCGVEVYLDGTHIKDFNAKSWQDKLFYIPQEPYIFHASLRENLCFYSPSAREGDIQKAIEMFGLGDLVNELPCGLDTVLDEGGKNLSAGQAQRIAFARAFLDPSKKIILLDEPTAHLDIETELELKKALLPFFEDKLVIIATHRLHWLENANAHMVLEDGRCIS